MGPKTGTQESVVACHRASMLKFENFLWLAFLLFKTTSLQIKYGSFFGSNIIWLLNLFRNKANNYLDSWTSIAIIL